MTSEPTDAELVSRLRLRQRGAFDDLYRRYSDRIWRFLRTLCGSSPVAEDLFQDTWLAAARNAHRLRPDTEVLSWLYTIARNKHRNSLRALVYDLRKRSGASAEPASVCPAPDAQTEVRRRTRAVADAFARLADAHREVLILHAIEGLDTDQIARVLGLRPDAVRKRLSRARAELLELTTTKDPEGASEK